MTQKTKFNRDDLICKIPHCTCFYHEIQNRKYVTVKDLRQMLDGVPEDTPVILSIDGEGNDYWPLRRLEEGNYDEELYNFGEDEGVAAVCLYPEG